VSSNPLPVRSLTERFYHPELDVLRFFAFFLIFLHHSLPHDPAFYTRMGVAPTLALVLAALGASGAYGVNLFFLLSSYLVTELLIRERACLGHIDLKAFYIRRILRIWPLYLSFLALAWAMQWFVPGQHIGWRAFLAFLFLGGNWWIVFVGFPSSVIFPLWFVSLQEQFYLFWPSTMRKLSERGMICSAAVMLVIATLTRWYLALQHTWESKLWCNTFVQLDAIALGIILAVILSGRAPRLSPLLRSALFIGGFTCLVLAGSYFRIKADPLTTSRVLLGYPVAALGAVALFLATLHHGGPPTSARSWRMWGLRPLVYLGRISYGLYVFHILGLMISDYTVQHQDSSLLRYLFRNAVAFAITVLLAAISYRWLEAPFLTLKQRFTRVLSRPGG
jgi:peptidoglycan/LPS O-acetylase OafA/YrhL